MKKLFGWFSLTILSIISIYICFKIPALPVDYAQTANSIMNTITKGQDLLVFNFRIYDYICEMIIIIAVSVGIMAIFRKTKEKEVSCNENRLKK